MRQVVLDTETTGLDPKSGHRIIEIGCLEIIDRQITNNHFHVYINPHREIDPGAQKVHGITNAFLADKPAFHDIVEEMLSYLAGAELVIHNAPFDIGFLNHELALLGKNHVPVDKQCTVIDTLVMARKKHTGQRNSLDALCKRYNVDNTNRELHGALLDSELLAQVYLRMTSGQNQLFGEEKSSQQQSSSGAAYSAHNPLKRNGNLPIITADELAESQHLAMLEMINKASEGQCQWPTEAAPREKTDS